MSDTEETDVTTSVLTGFLFGNIDQSGKLENDFLDQDICSKISTLANLGVGAYVDELKEDGVVSESIISRDTVEKDTEAVDYFNIETEKDDYEDKSSLLKDTAANSGSSKIYQIQSNGVSSRIDGSDDDYEQEEPTNVTSTYRRKENIECNNISMDKFTLDDFTMNKLESKIDTANNADMLAKEQKKRPRRRHKKKVVLDTPLGCMLPPHLAHINVTKYFSEFKKNKVLRFLKLFKPAHSCSLWKKKKPKSLNNIKTSKSEQAKALAKKNNTMMAFKEARLPFSHELDLDDLELMKKESGKREVATEEVSEMSDWLEWRHGAAKLWYDHINLSHNQHAYTEYALKIKQERQGKAPTESDVKLLEAVDSIQMQEDERLLDLSDLIDDNTLLTAAEEASSRNKEFYKTDDQPTQGTDKPTFTNDQSVTTSESKETISSGFELPEVPIEEGVPMVVQSHWENDIIWNGEDVRDKVMGELSSKLAKAGWLPHNNARTFQASLQHHNQAHKLDMSSNIYPPENSQLASGDWLKNIIWDNKRMDSFLTPESLLLDHLHHSLLLPETDDDLNNNNNNNNNNLAEANKNEGNKKELKKSKGSFKNLPIKDEPPLKKDEEVDMVGLMLADDEYYDPELSTENALGKNVCSTILQHSTPAVELRAVLFPYHLSITKLRNFHRPHLKKYSHGIMTSPGPHSVLPLLKQIRRKQKLREQEIQASGGGDVFFMRTLEDLSSRDGDMLLFEYCEQYPPLLNQVGMATKIKNYYKRRPGQESNPPQFEYGDVAYTHTPPFLGSIKPGQCLRSLENNMFRAPIYQHQQAPTDFFIIRNRNHYYIRDANAMFVVGQLCPLIVVPSPNSKKANHFVRESLQLSIYRLFSMSKDEPRKIRMEDVRRQFPSHSESSIRKKLKMYADFKRNGSDSGWWVWKGSVRFPSEEEMRRLLVPEQCCAYYSMLSAEQRLKDAGYGEKVLFSIEDADEDEVNNKLEDEVKAAPWNTTNAYISSMKGKCMLALGGFADPTSCGEGFAYVKVPNKPQQNKLDAAGQGVKKMVTGTDADLRRLPLKEAKELLTKLGIEDSVVKKMGRWEVIDMVRKMSTEKAKNAQDGSWVNKFARGNKLTQLEHVERYKQECQRIFDLQNRVLGSEEVLSTDEEESSGDDEDMENMGKSIEKMFSCRKTSVQVHQEREEKDREELKRLLKAGQRTDPSLANRKLQITRTFRGDDGKLYTRLEVVKKPALIDMYLKIRESKDPAFIQQFTMVDKQAKEEMKKEKKRIQEKLRKLKRQEAEEEDGNNDNDGDTPMSKKKLKGDRLSKNQKLTCGACGKTGHMRTNKECPMFNKGGDTKPSKATKVKDEEEEEDDVINEVPDNDELVNVEGTKVTLSKQIVKQAEDLKRRTLVLKLPGRKEEKKRKMSAQDDYLVKPRKVLKRCRADPVVSLMAVLQDILNEMRELPISTQFLQPVNSKKVPDYYNIIKKPMDLQTLRENLRDRKYTNREAFLKDVYLIVSNCKLYNGEVHPLSASAQKMFDHCLQRIAEKEEKLMKLEKLIDPLLDDDDMVSLAFIITSIIEDRLKVVEGSVQFHTPVNRKHYKDYYDIIKDPIDLKTMLKKSQERKYHNRYEFLKDMELLVSNCSKYNGPHSSLTSTAHVLLEKCKLALKEQEDTLDQLEENIRQTQEEYEDNDSEFTSVTGDADTRSTHPALINEDSKGAIKDNEDVMVDVEGDVSEAFKSFENQSNTNLSLEDNDRSGLYDDQQSTKTDNKEGEFDPQDFFNSLLNQDRNNDNNESDVNDINEDSNYNLSEGSFYDKSKMDDSLIKELNSSSYEIAGREDDVTKMREVASLEDDLQLSESDQSEKDNSDADEL